MPFFFRWVSWLIANIMARKNPANAALVRTSAALMDLSTTQLAKNALPQKGSITVTLRLVVVKVEHGTCKSAIYLVVV